MTRVVVVGAGIGGLATSIALHRSGVEVIVLERAAALAEVELGAGITLWANAMLMLDRLGVGDTIRERGAVLRCFEQRTARGRLLTRWPLEEMGRRAGAPICAISRPDLHSALARAGGERVKAGCEVERFELADGSVRVALSSGSQEAGDVLVGADGLESTIRRQLHGAHPPRHSGLTTWRASVPYDEAIAPDVDFVAWWGSGTRFVAFRSGPERLSWEGIVTSPPGGEDPPGARKQAALARFEDFTEQVERMIDATSEEAIFRTDVVDRRPDRHWGSGRVTLLGDAAHPMTFAVGQGAAQALEDADAIGRALGESGDLEAALRSYERSRIARAAHFQTLAWRLARAGTLESRPAQLVRNAALALTSPIVCRLLEKDITLPA